MQGLIHVASLTSRNEWQFYGRRFHTAVWISEMIWIFFTADLVQTICNFPESPITSNWNHPVNPIHYMNVHCTTSSGTCTWNTCTDTSTHINFIYCERWKFTANVHFLTLAGCFSLLFPPVTLNFSYNTSSYHLYYAAIILWWDLHSGPSFSLITVLY